MQRPNKVLMVLGSSLIILTLLLGLPSGGTRAASPTNALPANWIKGVNMIGYAPDPYKITNQHDAIASWKATGANAIAFAPRWFMDVPSSTAIVPDPSFGSPSDESLIAVIAEAHKQGLRVMLRPYLDVKDGSWRGLITPSNAAAWFANYTAFIDHYLDLAKANNVEEFTLGVEMLSMTDPKYDSYWLGIIADARARFPGLLTYSANWGKSQQVEYSQITWWGKLDYIGISAYFPLYEWDSPSLEQLITGWSNYTDHWGGTYNWVNNIKAVHDRFNKDVVFTEIGFGSYVNSPARWDQPEKSNMLDLGVQERAVEATMQVWSNVSWFRGIYWWHWEPYVGSAGQNDTSDALNNKPAVQVLTRWYGGSGQPPAPVPVPPAPQPGGQPRSAPLPGQASIDNPAFNPVPSPGADTSARIYFEATGHILQGKFYEYWKSHGGLWLFGYPLSEEYQEISATDGKAYTVQYFERQRFELHPEFAGTPNEVLLGLLGSYMVKGRTDGAFGRSTALPPSTSQIYFEQTGHNLGGSFLTYWKQYGGLPIFGYPLSEEFQERNEVDGKTYTVQYFERARFELHPEFAGTPNEVLLGLLGHWYAGR
ncbi:MAG: hypothetical protein ABI670_03470 [Chloroflexota bacterium]